jgi:hypothetical protein
MSASKILLALLVIAFGIYCSKQSKSESVFPSSTSFQPEQKEQKTQSGKCFEGSNGPRNVALDELEDDDYYGILDLKDDASMEEIRSVSEQDGNTTASRLTYHRKACISTIIAFASSGQEP